ncbi:diacylglycerol/lipid kinase family protein [Pseudarthrobacter sp. P1]|uniref:diacylglycerol/lipid kinase family protein n=1 Tax=Pseudarthrobacter sp. P1 TaxID=3418418 RepID=UPI003CEB4F80
MSSLGAPIHDVPAARVAAVVYNPVKVDLAVVKAVIAAEEKAGGWGPTLWFETSGDDPGQGPAKEALAAGADLVIAAGGDGTVRAVAEVLYGSGASLALLPSGTANLLARNLGLTLDGPKHAIHTAFTGHDRDIDLALIDIERDDQSTTRHAYLVMAGLGLDAKMLVGTDDKLKAKVGWLAYVGGLLTAMRDKEQLRMRYSLDGKEARSARVHTIIIGNCGSLPADIVLLPDAAIDDGMFELVLLRPKGLFGWLQITIKVLWENGVLRRTEAGRKLGGPGKAVRALHYVKGRKLAIRLTQSHDIELDGDSFGTVRALTTWIEPGALTVRVAVDDQTSEE